jgi:hypothetical protein
MPQIGFGTLRAFWLHLAQNYFALNYVNTIWTAAKSQPWPEVIRFW